MKRFITLFLATMLFSIGITAQAQENNYKKIPPYQYAETTEQNKDLFNVRWQNRDRFDEVYGHAVLISPENHKELVVRTEASSGLMRSDKRYAEVKLAVKKREENNQKSNPFHKQTVSFVRFPTLQLKNKAQGIPANASGYHQLMIFTKPDNTKWNVKKGQTLNLQYALDLSTYDSKLGDVPGKKVSIGYIKDEKMYELGVMNQQAVKTKFEIPVSGEIEFYMLNQNYTRLVVANGIIQVA